MIKRKITAAALIITLVMAGCSGNDDVLPSVAESTLSSAEAEIIEEINTEEKSSAETVLTGWEDMVFEFCGVEYVIPFTADLLNANNWTVVGTADEYPVDYVLQPGEKVSNVYNLFKEGLNSNARVSIGFINYGDSSAKITDCDVWSFVCSIYDETNKVVYEDVPDLKLANGITWGSTADEVETAYGEPISMMESQEGVDDYKVYTYMYNGLNIMKLTVRDDYGLVEVVLLSYNEE